MWSKMHEFKVGTTACFSRCLAKEPEDQQQDIIILAINNCYSSICVSFIDEKNKQKNNNKKKTKQPAKDYHVSNPNRASKPHHLSHGKTRDVFCWALPSGYEKSDRKPRPKPKPPLIQKHLVNMITFDIRTLNTINQLPELTASAIEYNIDIICVQEYRFNHSKVELKRHDTPVIDGYLAWHLHGKTLLMPPLEV